RITQRAGLWGVEGLDITTADNHIALDGLIGDSLSLDWQVNVPRVDQFLSEFSGSILGAGTASGSLDSPELNGALQAIALAGRGIVLESVELNFDGEAQGYSGTLSVQGVSLPLEQQELLITSANASWRGSRTDHSAELELVSNRGRLRSGFTGGFTGAAFSAWQGQIARATIENSEIGDWALLEPVDLGVAEGSLRLERGCWQQQQMRLCLDSSRNASGSTIVAADFSGFPLAEFNRDEQSFIAVPSFPHLPEEVALDGVARIELNAELIPGQQPELDFSASAEDAGLTISPQLAGAGALTEELAETDRRRYNWPLLELRGSLREGTWLINGEAELSREQIDVAEPGLNGSLRTQLELSAEDELGGNLSASFQDLGWIQALVPQLSAVAGSLDSSLSFSGTLTAPVVVGEFVLADGGFYSNRFGVAFTDIDAVLRADSQGNGSFEGNVQSGQGALEFSGEISELFSNSREVRGELQGTEFTFVDLPDLQLALSPTLVINASAQRIDLSGRVEVPTLQLTLRELPETAVHVSRDVAIISYPEDRPDLSRSLSAAQSQVFDIPVTGEIELVLGENIDFNGFGLTASFGGELQIQQTENGNNYTYGEVELVDGSYQMYGQTLQIRQGTVLFLGALDNPALDIRAVR
ncbi:MAG: translocation/assembly module TamB domain-containing protein, partial [Gammaproteobacteria bacterium]